jgi:WD40 repeat protein
MGVKISLIYKIDKAHENYIREISWSANSALGYYLLATGGEDQYAKIWKIYLEKDLDKCRHDEVVLGSGKFASSIWRVSWNFSGNLLAVGFSNQEGVNVVQVFAETEKDKWDVISDVKSE